MTQWQRTDGSLLGGEARERREELLDYFRYHRIPVLLEFYPEMDRLVGLSLLADPDGRTATMAGDSLGSGLELEDLAADIAERFDMGVMIGDISVEIFDDGIEFEQVEGGESGEEETPEEFDVPGEVPAREGDEPAGAEDDETEPEDVVDLSEVQPVRAITITSAGEEYFGLLARALGEPVTTATAGFRQVVVTSTGEQVPGTYGWDEDALPCVQLLAEGAGRTVIAQTDELYNTTRTWGAERILVAGEAELPSELAALALIDSDEDDARIIASVSPTADFESVRAALHAPPETGPGLLLEALGIGREFADFLDGAIAAEELPGARLYEPATTGYVFRSNVQEVLDDAADLKMVEMVRDFDERWPAVTRSLSVVKAAAGSGLLVAALRSSKQWRAAGALTGLVLVLDSLADIALYEWFRRKEESH
ncbi:MAG TPA: hypothetical protein VFC82_01395 [Actinomycetaceae bacterium]|nr:hypothetical protein [Actinomycetaceae bacterium]